MSKSNLLGHQTSYDVIFVKVWPTNGQILESDCGKP